MSALAELKQGWDRAAREDAMGNIASRRDKWTEGEFFASGQVEIDAAMDRLDGLGLSVHTGRALDFGCGIGRLTQALAYYFDAVDGVDVSAQMLKQARVYNQHGNVRYRVSGKRIPFGDGTFDLVYSMLVLQHMPQELAAGYVGEFVRVLAPGGVAVFQIPEGEDYRHETRWLSMFGTARETVGLWVEDAGGRLVDVDLEHGNRYTAVRA